MLGLRQVWVVTGFLLKETVCVGLRAEVTVAMTFSVWVVPPSHTLARLRHLPAPPTTHHHHPRRLLKGGINNRLAGASDDSKFLVSYSNFFFFPHNFCPTPSRWRESAGKYANSASAVTFIVTLRRSERLQGLLLGRDTERFPSPIL